MSMQKIKNILSLEDLKMWNRENFKKVCEVLKLLKIESVKIKKNVNKIENTRNINNA